VRPRASQQAHHVGAELLRLVEEVVRVVLDEVRDGRDVSERAIAPRSGFVIERCKSKSKTPPNNAFPLL
jgi:hypothetical protein